MAANQFLALIITVFSLSFQLYLHCISSIQLFSEEFTAIKRIYPPSMSPFSASVVPLVISRTGILVGKQQWNNGKCQSKNKGCDAKQHAQELFSVNTHNNIVLYADNLRTCKEHAYWLKSDPLGLYSFS